jgi:carbonyl reductase 1
MSVSRVGIVTGANKGIGFAIGMSPCSTNLFTFPSIFLLKSTTVRQLALQYPKSPYNNGPVVVYLTARDQGKGEKALQELQEDPSLKKAKALKVDGGLAQIKFHVLDISETKSIQDFASFLKAEHPEGIDFGKGSVNESWVNHAYFCSDQ